MIFNMTSRIRRCYRLPLLVWCCLSQYLIAPLCPAQTHETRSLEFTLLGWEGTTPEFAFKTGGRTEKIRAPEFARSRVVKYTGPADLVFTLDKTPPTKDPVTTSVTLPANSKRVTIITVKTASNKYGMMAFPDDASDYPAGHARIQNLTKETLAINYNLHTTAPLEPGKALIIPGEKERLIIKAARRVDGEWKLASEAVLGLEPSERLGVILAKSNASIFKVTYYDGTTTALNDIQVFAIPPWPAEGTPEPQVDVRNPTSISVDDPDLKPE